MLLGVCLLFCLALYSERAFGPCLRLMHYNYLVLGRATLFSASFIQNGMVLSFLDSTLTSCSNLQSQEVGLLRLLVMSLTFFVCPILRRVVLKQVHIHHA